MLEQENSPMMPEISVARFHPMRRLLSGKDEEFLRSQGFNRQAAQLRSHHRKLFFRFVMMLEKDFGRVHAARKAAMVDDWNFEVLLRERWNASSYLWAMRLAGLMHWMYLPQAAGIAERYVGQLEQYLSVDGSRMTADRLA